MDIDPYPSWPFVTVKSRSETKRRDVNISELVAGAIVTAPREMKLVDVAKLMEAEGVGSVAVVDQTEDFIGIVTDRDIVHAVARSEEEATAGDVMTEAPDTIEIDTEISEAVAWMNATGCRHLPVTDNGSLVGMVSIKDLLWAIAGT